MYTDAQAKYIESFFAQNGYIEYSLVRNLGINDPEGQTRSVLKDRQQILFLISGCIDLVKFLPQLEMNIEQGLLSNDYVDLTALVPNSFNEHDVEKLLKAESSINALIQSSGGEQISNTFVISKELQEKIEKKLNQLCQDCAEKVSQHFLVRSLPHCAYLQESAHCTPQIYAAVLQGNIALASASATKGATGKKSAAAASKRKGGASKAMDDVYSSQETIPFVSQDEMKSQIRLINEELPDEIIDLLADNLYRYVLRGLATA